MPEQLSGTVGTVQGSQIGHRARRFLADVLRFLVVGGLATLVSLVGFNALVHGVLLGAAPMRHQPIVAYVLANATAGLMAYVGMRWWAFGHREVADPVESLARFFALGAATMLIPVFCLAFSRYVLGLSSAWADNVAANVIGLGLSTVARFWAFRRYVFVAGPQAVHETGIA